MCKSRINKSLNNIYSVLAIIQIHVHILRMYILLEIFIIFQLIFKSIMVEKLSTVTNFTKEHTSSSLL
jgi:hypothetical protein